MARLRIVFRLGLKELWAVLRDPVLLGLVAYTFTLAIVTVARGVRTEVRDAAIAVVDLDGSALSVRLAQAFLPPWFKPARAIGEAFPALYFQRITAGVINKGSGVASLGPDLFAIAGFVLLFWTLAVLLLPEQER